MEARLFQTNENTNNQEYVYIDSIEQKKLFYTEANKMRDLYKGKIYDKEKNTIYGHKIEIVELQVSKIINSNSEDNKFYKAIRVGNVYILETKDMPPIWSDYQGYSIEELYNELVSSDKLLTQINPIVVEFGYDPGTQTCNRYNFYTVYKQENVIREL